MPLDTILQDASTEQIDKEIEDLEERARYLKQRLNQLSEQEQRLISLESQKKALLKKKEEHIEAREAKRQRLISDARKNKIYGKFVSDFVFDDPIKGRKGGFVCQKCGVAIPGLFFDDHFFWSHEPIEKQVKAAAKRRKSLEDAEIQRLKEEQQVRENKQKRDETWSKKGFIKIGVDSSNAV